MRFRFFLAVLIALTVSACATHRSGYQTAEEISWYEDGYAQAKADIAQGHLRLTVPGSPPVPWVYEYRSSALAEYEIEWVLTGDVFQQEAFVRQQGYNSAMSKRIAEQFGATFLDSKLAEIQQEIDAQREKLQPK